MDDHFRIHGRLKDATPLHQLAAQNSGVGQIAVVADGEAACLQLGEQGLDIPQNCIARGGIAVVPQGGIPRQAGDHSFGIEVVTYMAKAAMGIELLVVMGDDPGGFLAAMLKGV